MSSLGSREGTRPSLPAKMIARNVRVPPELARHDEERLGKEGLVSLERLPTHIAECAKRWSLTLHGTFPHLSINYAAYGTDQTGSAIVLKMCFPDNEFISEAEGLRLCERRGAVRLLAVDTERGGLLLERLLPGEPLLSVADDQHAISVAVNVMQRLWRPVPSSLRFPSYSGWVRHMADRAPRMFGPEHRQALSWVQRATALRNDLDSDGAEPVVLHGDLHQGNILSAERAPWLAIDPKGIVGQRICETGPLLLNVLPPLPSAAAATAILERRTAQLADELGFDRELLRAWGVVRAVLSAFWSIEDHHDGWWRRTLLVAESLAGMIA